MLSCRTFVFFCRKKFKMFISTKLPLYGIIPSFQFTLFVKGLFIQWISTSLFRFYSQMLSMMNIYLYSTDLTISEKEDIEADMYHLKHSRAADNWASRASGPPRIGYTYTIRMYPGTYVILHLVHTQSVEQPRWQVRTLGCSTLFCSF